MPEEYQKLVEAINNENKVQEAYRKVVEKFVSIISLQGEEPSPKHVLDQARMKELRDTRIKINAAQKTTLEALTEYFKSRRRKK
jgi:hypothetical protein